jgi:hypothetical protein
MERKDVNLTHRYLKEYGIDRETVDKAFCTLELCCIGDEAKQSLEVIRSHSNPCECVLASSVFLVFFIFYFHLD